MRLCVSLQEYWGVWVHTHSGNVFKIRSSEVASETILWESESKMVGKEGFGTSKVKYMHLLCIMNIMTTILVRSKLYIC